MVDENGEQCERAQYIDTRIAFGDTQIAIRDTQIAIRQNRGSHRQKASKLVVHVQQCDPRRTAPIPPRGVYRRRNGLECAWFNQLSRSTKILRFEAGKFSGTSYNQEDAG
ncbi:Methyltransferase domain protein [Mesorhizobium loti]|nr:Methyltransferase domain protein [Mesorhizobium loti]